jgi:starch phosphorylase
MVREYTERFYLPTARHALHLRADAAAPARALTAWKNRVRAAWNDVRIESTQVEPRGELPVGAPIQACASVHLGALTPDDVVVELYAGRIGHDDEFIDPVITPMQPDSWDGGPRCRFTATAVPGRTSGLHGYSVRVRPYHPDLVPGFIPGLLIWAQPAEDAAGGG